MTKTSDLLPAAGFMLASISLLFSAWYRDMRDSISEVDPNTVDGTTAWKARRRTQRLGRALPLVVALLGFVLVFAEVAVEILSAAATRVFHPSRWDDYDPLEAAFLLVWLFAAGMLLHALSVYRSLRT